ncbi:hypothetical protein OS493_032002 [Desmophyllum pertusum]|uniref:Uncharacterized protein n=1 Tax=Desmophyllum pertusum TaxID=174260 RepID=A0A9W9ZB80_9CNID|nr:hypothetical protein OS493_032002 [Desmophyllum pertusum]
MSYNGFILEYLAQKGRENPKTKGPQKDHEGRKALSPLSRNIIRKDFHNTRDSLNKIMDAPEQCRSVKFSTLKKSPSVKTPSNYVPVWKRPFSNTKSPSPNQSPQTKALSSAHGNPSVGQVKALEKLSKSLQISNKTPLAVGESYQDLMPVINEDNPVQYRYPEKRVSHSRQRPKSLNFEIFINEQEEKKLTTRR